ncbi:MAG: mannose-1-phosphate guanylyltransferase/mannose-6-phosphate isomerase [Burkholderiaceae bacterium]|nr:mannose-1-phosphate guanylyltransferase/mannose-6-phosphate isomerase [Burkholderiaceae bacterium]
MPNSSNIVSFVPVVLCGGSGTRLWPLSRNGYPKQFLVLQGNDSLFQLAVQRLADLGGQGMQADPALIVTNDAHRFLATEQLREIHGDDKTQLLLEPQGRNTAPAITLAAMAALARGADPVMVVSPADQIVTNRPAFTKALRNAIERAATGVLVVLGVTPTHPETGYGYIQREPGNSGELSAKVRQFTEKPDLQTAQKYVEAGNYLWNAGLFVVKASVWLKAIKKFGPDVHEAVQQAWDNKTIDHQFIRPQSDAFLASPSISADYAVIEKCPGSEFDIDVVELDAGWSDLGAWDAVWQVGQKDGRGNVTHGDAITIETNNCLVHANHRLVGTVGVDDLVVIETADAVLVGRRDQAQRVKEIVQTLSTNSRSEPELHRKVHRPWGWYDSIDEGSNFKVKRIMVKPGASISLQKHHHRAEHWIVVRGKGQVTCDDKVLDLGPNQSTYIPLGSVHRLANPGLEPLEIVEVQSGNYLGEDDIVRFEDNYGRANS